MFRIAICEDLADERKKFWKKSKFSLKKRICGIK